MRCEFLLATLLLHSALPLAFAKPPAAEGPPALPHAHAHNDYYHDRPLLDALDHGFCSVEADIFLIDGKLLVGHSRWELHPKRTLQALYLDPLFKRAKDNGGWIFSNEQPITLLVDIKAEGEATYRALREALKPYHALLSSVKADQYHRGAIEIVLSGDRPRETVAAQTERYVFIDGRVNELTESTAANLVPLVSENWNSLFSWRGQGPMPTNQRDKLHKLVETMHHQGRRLRFWATPESPAFWEILAEEQVDLIGTDDLDRLQTFWVERQERASQPAK